MWFYIIKFMQSVFFYSAYQNLRIFRIGSISSFFKPICPAFVIFDIQFKKPYIILSRCQKQGMVSVRFSRVIIHTEALIWCVICMFHGFSCPVFFTFYPKVIFPFFCQTALSSSCFQNPLSEFDTCWNFIQLHLFHCIFSEILDVLVICFPILSVRKQPQSCH